jgi:hypothetical protein
MSKQQHGAVSRHLAHVGRVALAVEAGSPALGAEDSGGAATWQTACKVYMRAPHDELLALAPQHIGREPGLWAQQIPAPVST